MKKFAGISVALLVVGLLVTFVAGTVLAAAPDQATTSAPGIGARLGQYFSRGAQWMVDTIAKLLGMTTAEVQAQRLAGKSMVQIAESKGVSKETLVNTVLDTRKAQLDVLVKDGKITQAQADLALANMKARVTANLERTTTGPASQGYMGKGGRNGAGMGTAQAVQNGAGYRGQGRGLRIHAPAAPAPVTK